MKRSKKFTTFCATMLLAVGFTVAGTTQSDARIDGFYNMASRPYEALAHIITHRGDQGTFQAYAKLGNQTQWGARSAWNSKAHLRGGWHFSHDSKIYRNGQLALQG